ncbi:MAG TPA: OmpA family protein [Tepidisphaeraceae bacterium]|jgi:flagellar motor protein MotB
MKRSSILGSLVLVAAAGCVPEEKYRAAKMEAENYRQQLAGAQVDVASAQQRADTLQKQLEALNANSGNATGLVNNLQMQLAGKQSELDELNRRYAEAIAKAGSAAALPAPLTNELSSLAAANPDLIEFDAGRGIVKFKSDLTFDLGDATVKPAARTVLEKFAAILNSPAAAPYELLVAGHTDATPVSNPVTVQKGHKNNWYLSAHRAITVGEALVGQKVNAQRVGVVGYADQRPVASNGTDSGRAQNRRVEVLILPTQVRIATTQEAAPAAAAPRKPEQTKDAGVTPPTGDSK